MANCTSAIAVGSITYAQVKPSWKDGFVACESLCLVCAFSPKGFCDVGDIVGRVMWPHLRPSPDSHPATRKFRKTLYVVYDIGTGTRPNRRLPFSGQQNTTREQEFLISLIENLYQSEVDDTPARWTTKWVFIKRMSKGRNPE
eukprot:scaffold1665_cov149-Skeletonema_menzelii.AAC.9